MVQKNTEDVPTVLSQGTVAASVELNSTPVKCHVLKKYQEHGTEKLNRKNGFLPSNSISGEMIFFPVTGER